MAYAALVSLSQIIDKIVLQDHDQHSNNSFHEKQRIKCLHENLIFLQAFLEDFPEKAIGLEPRMRDAANEAEDIIEYFMSEEIQSSVNSGQHRPELGVRYDFQKLNQELQKETEEIDSITREVMEIKNSTTTEDVQLSEYSSVAASSSNPAPTSKDAMVGFEDDLMAIKGRLCGESPKLQVIPIFGMGGIGKTTLAKNVYGDPLTVEHFDICAWVTVSQDYSAREILSGFLVSIKAERSRERDESMEEIVYKRLKGRRYLIVMDDMWSTKTWDDFKMIFPDDYNGSRIILTTRLYNVAAYPHSSGPIHEMHFMDVEQSWNLLQQKVFVGESCPPELEIIGKMIARTCRGLPLAIVLIAGVLSMVSKTQESWKKIAERVNLAINTTNDEQFAKVLSLSYIDLPHNLRPCFLYMGSFREDYEIRISRLIKLWMAEGFLKPNGSKSFEEIAEECLEDLVKRSLVLVSRRKSNGKIKSLSIHDLVRDLCIRKAQEEKFFLNLMDRNFHRSSWESIKNQRRITVTHSLDCFEDICSPTIRTIIYFKYLRSLGNFKLLRVLDALIFKVRSTHHLFLIPMLPAQVFELFHLRYLAFTCGERFVLPRSIVNLQNLQTLIIQQGRQRMKLLSMEIWRMPLLRHLSFFGTFPDPEGAATFALANLQTLSEVKNFKCTDEILKLIPNLKRLEIFYSRQTDVQESRLENLIYLHQLENLKLQFESTNPYQEKLNAVYPTSLKKLVLSGCRLPWKDMSIVGLLPNLEVLKLRNYACFGDKWETIEGEFPQLKFLLIDESELQEWITESCHFPSLRCLVLYRCQGLSEIPDGIGEIPTLELIEVDDLNKSLVGSAKSIQEEQQENCGDTALQVHIGNRHIKF